MESANTSDEALSAKAYTRSEPVPRSPIESSEQKATESTIAQPKAPEAVKAVVTESKPAASAPTTSTKAVATEAKPPVKSVVKESEPKGILKGKGKSKETIPEIKRSTPSIADPKANPEVKTLASALQQFMETQNALAQATGSGVMPTGNPGEAVSNPSHLLCRADDR